MVDIFKMFPDLSPSVTALNYEKAMNHKTVWLLCRCFCVQAIDLRTLLPILILLESSSICRQGITKCYSYFITCKYFCMHTIDHNQVQLLPLCESVMKQSITSHISTSLVCSCFSTGTASLLLFCACVLKQWITSPIATSLTYTYFYLQSMDPHLVWLLLLGAVCYSRGARILGIFPTPSISHQLPFQAIMKALAARGHQITVISPDPLKVSLSSVTAYYKPVYFLLILSFSAVCNLLSCCCV
jgi:hypothetical protein